MKKDYSWTRGFWLGIAVLSIINTALMFLHKDPLLYNLYILGVAFIILIIYAVISSRKNKKR